MYTSSSTKLKSNSSARNVDWRRRKSEAPEPTSSSVQKMLETQESLADVLFVREELMSNVLRKCYENDINERSISFMVRCAYKAMLQIIDTEFYFHDSIKNDIASNPEWMADQAPLSSPPDTWAAYNVPIVSGEGIECKDEAPKVLSQESFPVAEVGSVITDYSGPGSLISAEPYGSHSLSDYSECLLGPNVSEELLSVTQLEEENSIDDVESEKSLFTRIATLDTDIDTSRVYGDYKRRETVRLPKLHKLCFETAKVKPAEMKVSAFTFPPLRADTILQRAPSPIKDDKKKRNSK